MAFKDLFTMFEPYDMDFYRPCDDSFKDVKGGMGLIYLVGVSTGKKSTSDLDMVFKVFAVDLQRFI